MISSNGGKSASKSSPAFEKVAANMLLIIFHPHSEALSVRSQR